MKKVLILLFILIIFVISVSAFSFEDFIIGLVVDNKEPSATLLTPIKGQVINSPFVFSWTYFDPEDDELEYYILQIDDDSRFFSSMNFKGKGESQKISLDKDGLFYWRVLVVNKYGQKFSKVQNFYLDSKTKVCEDGTPFFECSLNRPHYCSGGVLKEDCQKCNCGEGDICQGDGSCLTRSCIDGTAYSQCAYNKPFFCLNGKLTEVCSLCGCDEEEECLGDGSCGKVIVENEVNVIEEKELSFIEKIALFFKNLFSY